mmetsp:Transcript_1357/g.4560  ORF Transcript_1357/g.4560 Transcript_1357/m.4560 type:complete len:218 (-) Transcript_1357:1351-2004(-)
MATENSGGIMHPMPHDVGDGNHCVAFANARAIFLRLAPLTDPCDWEDSPGCNRPGPCKYTRPKTSAVRNKSVATAAQTISTCASTGNPFRGSPPTPPPVSACATAIHATAAGAGNTSPPSGCASRSSAYVGTAPNNPAGIPAICANSCFRGDKPISRPALKSCIRSPACPAAPHETAAAIRLATVSPGATTANTSCTIFPIGPTGLMSVSPAHRTAT